MPFPLALLYYLVIAPACVISERFDKYSRPVWWFVVHTLLYTYFIVLPLWLVFDVSLVSLYVVYLCIEVLIHAIHWYTNTSMHR